MNDTTLMDRRPTEMEAFQASEAMKVLASFLTPKGDLDVRIEVDGSTAKIELPAALGQLVLDLLAHVSRREMVTLLPYGAELTTNQAADLLNVSRPHLIKLLNEGEIGHHKVGSHRRVKAEDVLAYRQRRDAERKAALKELTRLGQEADAT